MTQNTNTYFRFLVFVIFVIFAFLRDFHLCNNFWANSGIDKTHNELLVIWFQRSDFGYF